MFYNYFLSFDNVGAEIEMDASAKFVCKVTARPTADIKWLKDDKPLTTDENINISADSSELIINRMKPKYSGRYVCSARNGHHQRALRFFIGISGTGMFIERYLKFYILQNF